MNDLNIKQCTVVLTRACNLRCNFCFAKRAGYNKKNTISFENLKKIVDFCNDLEVKYLFFTGGESLLYPQFIDILQYIQNKKYSIIPTVATNGILLKDYDFCSKLKDSGLNYIDLSIKGKNDQEWFNLTRRSGFTDYLKAVKNLSLLNIDFTCSMVVTLENVDSVVDSIKVAHENGGKQFSFTFFIDNNNLIRKDFDYLIKYNIFTLIEKFILQIENINKITNDWWIEYSFPLCVFTNEQLNLLKDKMATPCQIHKKSGITINTNLELLPCDMYTDLPLAKFGKDFSSVYEFKKLVESSQYVNQMKVLRDLPSEECISCSYLDKCFGGCPVLWKHYSFESLQKFKAAYCFK